MAKQIRIAIADDQTLVCQSLARALETDKQFIVVGTAANGKELIAAIERNPPDVILLDLEMPVMNGWETLDYLKINHPRIKVVIISMYLDKVEIKDLVESGASGFLPKNIDFDTLLNSIYEVHELGYFFSRKISQIVLSDLLKTQTINPKFKSAKLTLKEKQTLMQICRDKPNKEIADELQMAERSIERFKSNLYRKTRTKTTAGLVLYALRNNLIKLGT